MIRKIKNLFVFLQHRGSNAIGFLMETLSQAKWHNYTLETKNPLYSKLYNK